MDLTFIFVFVVVFLLCYLYVSRPKNLPPGPPGVPVLGTIGFQRDMQNTKPALYLMEESKKYGPIIQTKIFNLRTVYLIGFDAIHQAFVKQADVFSDRPNWMRHLRQSLKQGKGVIWQNGAQWKMMRKFTLQTLREFGVGKTSLEEKIVREVDDMSQMLSAGKPTDIRHLMSMAISNVIYGINFGSRFEYSDSEFQNLIHKLDVLFSGNNLRAILPLTFLPACIRNRIPLQGIQQLRKKQESIKWIQAHIFSQISRHKETYDPDTIRDFVDLYIQTVNEQKTGAEGNGFTDGNVFRVIMDLFIAGSETTFNTLNWAILYMIEYPDVQTRCQEEMEQVFGQKQISWSDRGKLQFIEATLLEIQRLSNIAPMSVPHTTTVDTTLMGYFIPKDTIVVGNLTSSNMDPKYWDEPDKFNPGRFLSDSGRVVRKDAFMPFSVGPRTCLGESLARMEMFLIFTNLLQRFTFRKESQDTVLDFTPRMGQVTNAPHDYKAVATNRN